MQEVIMKQQQLESKLNNHIVEFDKHVESSNLYRKQDQERWATSLKAQEEYNKNIDRVILLQEQNTANIKHLTYSTSELIEAWRMGQSVVKAGSIMGRFIKWLSGVAIIGVGVSWIIEHLPN